MWVGVSIPYRPERAKRRGARSGRGEDGGRWWEEGVRLGLYWEWVLASDTTDVELVVRHREGTSRSAGDCEDEAVV